MLPSIILIYFLPFSNTLKGLLVHFPEFGNLSEVWKFQYYLNQTILQEIQLEFENLNENYLKKFF